MDNSIIIGGITGVISQGLTWPMEYLKTKKQLEQWKVKYHKLIMGKPSFDILIDDKSLNFKKNWLFEIDKKIK